MVSIRRSGKGGTSGGGTPSNSVTNETLFGQTSIAGSATDYSRGDHTHGTPTNPVPAHEGTYDHSKIHDPATPGDGISVVGQQITNSDKGSTAVSSHASVTSSVHNFDASGNAPAIIHGSAKHTGTIGTWAQIDKATSDIADITTKSHTSLSDKGTNTHATIDSHIGSTSNPHSVTAAQAGALVASAFSGLAKITVGITEPPTPGVGDLWVDTN